MSQHFKLFLLFPSTACLTENITFLPDSCSGRSSQRSQLPLRHLYCRFWSLSTPQVFKPLRLSASVSLYSFSQKDQRVGLFFVRDWQNEKLERNSSLTGLSGSSTDHKTTLYFHWFGKNNITECVRNVCLQTLCNISPQQCGKYPAHPTLPLSLPFSLDNESNFRLSVFLCLWPSAKRQRCHFSIKNHK